MALSDRDFGLLQLSVDAIIERAMSRAVLKFAQQASLCEQATRSWLAFQYLG